MAGLSLGIDCGSTTVKGVLFDGTEVINNVIVPTSARPALRMREVYDALHSPDVKCVVTTGYGRGLLNIADKQVTEITCHAMGAGYLSHGICGVIDIGGQDSKAIMLAVDGGVSDFLMNDKCAAGTGRFVEMMCRILECDGNELDNFAKIGTAVNISSMCTVFAESEIISLLAQGVGRADIALGVVESICNRTATFASRLSLNGDVFFSGGLARHEVFRASLERNLGQKIITHPKSQLCGAIGAAIIGWRNI